MCITLHNATGNVYRIDVVDNYVWSNMKMYQ